VSRAIETLLLYKRHTPDCEVHKSRIARKNRRFYFDCGCPIYIKGRAPNGDLVPRQSTGHSDLKRAEALRNSLLIQVKGDEISGPTVAECIEKYLLSRERELDERTLAHHKLALERLQLFLQVQGVL
jgi:hypothetical protein